MEGTKLKTDLSNNCIKTYSYFTFNKFSSIKILFSFKDSGKSITNEVAREKDERKKSLGQWIMIILEIEQE